MKIEEGKKEKDANTYFLAQHRKKKSEKIKKKRL